jgi:hypothetical protein
MARDANHLGARDRGSDVLFIRDEYTGFEQGGPMAL